MITFLDGPAKGTTLDLKRAPKYLRVAIDAKGEVDALDQLDDTPRDDETLHAYRMVGQPTRYHVCRSPRKLSGWHNQAEYEMVDEQPQDEVLRDTQRWQQWAAWHDDAQ